MPKTITPRQMIKSAAKLAASLKAKGLRVVRLRDDGRSDIRGKQARYIRKFGPDVCFIITGVGAAMSSPGLSTLVG